MQHTHTRTLLRYEFNIHRFSTVLRVATTYVDTYLSIPQERGSRVSQAWMAGNWERAHFPGLPPLRPPLPHTLLSSTKPSAHMWACLCFGTYTLCYAARTAGSRTLCMQHCVYWMSGPPFEHLSHADGDQKRVRLVYWRVSVNIFPPSLFQGLFSIFSNRRCEKPARCTFLSLSLSLSPFSRLVFSRMEDVC